jgi:hypothetical protein
LQIFNNEGKLPLPTMYIDAGKVFQQLHNEGLSIQSISMDSYYENLYVINNVESGVVDQDTIHQIILDISEARS